MNRWVRCFLWIIILFLGMSTPVYAQNLLDSLLGQSQSASTRFEFNTPTARQLVESQERLKRIRVTIDSFRKKNKEALLTWEKEAKYFRTIVNKYQLKPEFSDWRNTPELIKLRADLVAIAEQNISFLSQVQSAYASHEQNLLSLRDTLKDFVKSKKTFEQYLAKQYVQPKLRAMLEKDLSRVKIRVIENRKAFAASEERVKSLAASYETNQKSLTQARLLLIQQTTTSIVKPLVRVPEPSKLPENKPSTQPTSRPTSQQDTQGVVPPVVDKKPVLKSALELRQERYQRRLGGMLRRLRFDTFRLQAQWLRMRQRDETVEQEVALWRVRLFQDLSSQMADAHKQMVSHSRTGLWYRRSLQWNKALLVQVSQHTIALVKKAPKQTNDVWRRLQIGWQFLDQTTTSLILFLSICGIFFLFYLTKRTRSRLEQSIQTLSLKVEGSKTTRLFWQTLLLVFRSVYDLLPFFGVLLLMGGLLWGLTAPISWQSTVWSLGLILLSLRAIDTLTKQLFHPQSEFRLFQNVDDKGAQRFRRVIRFFLLFALIYFPIVFAAELLGYPESFLHMMKVAFYGFLVFCLLLLLIRQDVILSLIPSTSVLGRAMMLAIHRFYPALFLLAVGLYGIYVYGYINFATFLAWGLLLSTVVLAAALSLYRLFWSFGLVFFGFSKESTGLVKVEKKLARSLLQLGRFLVSIVLGLVSLSLLLEIWGVAGGFRTIWKLFNAPFLQVKDTQLSSISMMKFALVLTAALIISRWLKDKFTRYVYPAMRLSIPNQHAVNTVVVYSIWIIGFLTGLQWMGIGLGVLTVFAGVIGIGVGFGLQNIASNFISGLMITFGKPIKVGDLIEVGSMMGEVKEISARSTTIETFDYRIVLIPNSEILTTKVVNWSLGQPFIMAKLAVGVAYGSDVGLVMATLREVALTHPKVLRDPEPALRFGDFGSSSLDFSVWIAVTNPMDRFSVISELRVELDRRFRELNITIAFPQQDIHLDGKLEDALIHTLVAKSDTATPSQKL